MILRESAALIKSRLSVYPAVALVGPRQCGKTTLAASLGGRYFDLERHSDRLKLSVLWNEIEAEEKLVVLDEAQSDPELFPRLLGAIDRDRKRNGRFLLLGSVSPALMAQVGESLAGRLSVLELAPLLLHEVPSGSRLNQLWLYGGYPDGGILDAGMFPIWQHDYLSLMSQRDLPNWGMAVRPQTTARLFRMLAAAHGQDWNASQIGQSLGISYHTVNAYLEYLTGAFLIRFLPAYHSNIKKRLVKRPKMYWRDTGLLHGLLGIQTLDELLSHPSAGASWEGFAINQILSALDSKGVAFAAYRFRSSDQKEIDLLLALKTQLWAVEIKLTSNPSRRDLQQLSSIADMIGADQRVLLCYEHELLQDGKEMICDLSAFLERISDLNVRG